ncbi:Tir chaperone family protein [Aeromonas salmonicida]|uniref:CesT family type III secretion system chaperone n=1 Tax=Aeromonas salmonicida TaxID=645 RepID=UPI000F786552|nr:CesT family type III secretion system chaperone [Aeromonas salmonicida]RSM27010.1 Tir chaperone family protein [Aeromonas salmonicida]
MSLNTYHTLVRGLLSRLGITIQPSDEGVYALLVDGRLQVMIGCYQEQWLQLFCELGPCISPSDNLFGAQWPAHVQGSLDGQAILWSQCPLAQLDQGELEAWLERFIDDAETRLAPSDTQASFQQTQHLLRI